MSVETWKVVAVLFGLIAMILFTLWGIGAKVAELSQTLKRIEARMTLSSPLEDEAALMERGIVTLRGGLRDRAMHPDIWISKFIEEERDLQGKQLKDARWLRKYTERRHRD